MIRLLKAILYILIEHLEGLENKNKVSDAHLSDDYNIEEKDDLKKYLNSTVIIEDKRY